MKRKFQEVYGIVYDAAMALNCGTKKEIVLGEDLLRDIVQLYTCYGIANYFTLTGMDSVILSNYHLPYEYLVERKRVFLHGNKIRLEGRFFSGYYFKSPLKSFQDGEYR